MNDAASGGTSRGDPNTQLDSNPLNSHTARWKQKEENTACHENTALKNSHRVQRRGHGATPSWTRTRSTAVRLVAHAGSQQHAHPRRFMHRRVVREEGRECKETCDLVRAGKANNMWGACVEERRTFASGASQKITSRHHPLDAWTRTEPMHTGGQAHARTCHRMYTCT
jgi:hypothetical protein